MLKECKERELGSWNGEKYWKARCCFYSLVFILNVVGTQWRVLN